MPETRKPAATGRNYQIGDIGSGARVAVGENISWIEGVEKLPGGESLAQQFKTLLGQIAGDKSFDEDTRALAQDKVKAVAEGFANAQASPGSLRRALLDAKSWFGNTATWVGKALSDILRSEPGQKALGAVAEGVTKAAVDSFLM